MDSIPLLIVGGVALVVLTLARALLSRKRPRPNLPFTRRRSLLTAGEMRFYRALLQALPTGVTVFVKVRLMDLVSVPDQAWRECGARGSGMHVDFVLADALTLAPLLVVELDDKSHRRPEAKERDAFKDAALKAGGVPGLRVKVAMGYDLGGLRAGIKKAIG